MVNVDKIKKRAKESGISITYLCKSIGQGAYYFNDVKKRGGNISAERLEKIAGILNTTVAYLMDETDDPAPNTEPSVDSDKPLKVTENDLKVALFGGDGEVTDEMWEEVKRFAEFVKQNKGKK